MQPSHDKQLYEGVRFAWLCFAVRCPWTGGDAAPAPTVTPPAIKPWRITALRLVAKFQPVSYTGSFASSDERLEKVWYTGAYGIRANMQGNDFGSILIDRGDRSAFQGDGHPSMAAAEAAFGSPQLYELTRLGLEVTDCHSPINKQGQQQHQVCRFPNGTVAMPAGSYPVYWTMSVMDFLWASGDVVEFNKLLPDVEAILDDQIKIFDQCLLTTASAKVMTRERCNYEFIGWDDRTGIGGSNPMAADGEPFRVYNSLVTRAIRELADALNATGATAKAAHYRTAADGFAAKIRAAQPPDSFHVHSAAHAANAGIFDTPSAQAVAFAKSLNDSTSICSLSPFNTFYIVQALANLGHLEHAVAAVNHCWAPMTRLAHGCFLELFDPDWADAMHVGQKAPSRPSYCHPWSSGAIPFLSKFVLGVQPVTVGFESVTVTPFVSSAWPTLGGALPVHSGKGALNLNASFVAGTAGAATVTITTESPVPASIGLPVSAAAGCTLESIGVLQGASTSATRSFGPANLAYMFTASLAPGKHTAVGHYTGCATAAPAAKSSAVYPFPTPAYPATVTLDSTTRGDWVGKYGSEAYALFGFDRGNSSLGGKHHKPSHHPAAAGSAAVDRTHIPTGSFVHSFSFASGCGDHPVPTYMAGLPGLANATLLADPAGASKPRSLGYASGGGDGSQGLYLDVNSTAGVKYQLAVYMVGSAGDLSIQVSRVMDLETLNPIAKGVKIAGYGAGQWLVLEYDRSLRVQLTSIDGLSTVSAAMVSKV